MLDFLMVYLFRMECMHSSGLRQLCCLVSGNLQKYLTTSLSMSFFPLGCKKWHLAWHVRPTIPQDSI